MDWLRELSWPSGKKTTAVFLLLSIMTFLFNSTGLLAEELDLTDLSLEELMDIKVTSVSKKSQTLSESAAAIFVITHDDLNRSGVTNIPDALRMVPGINVARIDANKWAVNSRGFNSRFSAQLLVLIDGRSVYTPTFSGVYWETNTVLLEDVDRIEVIRGPGATLWGANAVNGVINIITKHSKETQGGIVCVGGGDFEKAMTSARYGSSLGEDTHWRIYAKHNERDEFKDLASGKDAGDDWEITQAGFRIDSRLTRKDKLTVQGDIFQGEIHQNLNLVDLTQSPYMNIFHVKTSVSGRNLLSRWEHTLSSTSDFALQVYYDTTKRTEDFINEERDNIDIDFQHHFVAGTRHDIIWGGRYRYTHDDFVNSSITDMNPLNRHDDLYSAFVQDEISFFENQVRLTLGSKFEYNDYSDSEIQPSARLMWVVNSENKIWGAVSKAVRTPSRAETDARVSYLAMPVPVPFPPSSVPLVVDMVGNKNFYSEELIAYEIGYRFIPTQKFSMDMTIFYNEYDNLRGFEINAPVFTGTSFQQDLLLVNPTRDTTYGGELAATFMPTDFFKCDLAYGFIHVDGRGVGGFPKHQASARGLFKLTKTLDLDIWLRYVDDTNAAYLLGDNFTYQIKDYFTMDMRLAWKVTPGIELSLVGQNLLESTHLEYVQEAFSLPTEVGRSFYGKLTYRF